MSHEWFQAGHDQLAEEWMQEHPGCTEEDAYAATEDKAEARGFDMAIMAAEAYSEGDR